MWSAFRAIVAVAAGAALTLAQLSLPTKDFWPANSVLLYGCVGLVAVQEVAARVGDGWQSEAARRYDRNVLAALNAGLKATAEHFAVPWDQVGVHVFVARRRAFTRRLAKVGGVRMGSRPSLDRSNWRPGKGIVGVAWRSESLEAVDWQSVAGVARTSGKAGWDGQPRQVTHGLSWQEMQATFDYKGIVAYPVYDGHNRLTGCVTIDAPLSLRQLRDDAMRRILKDVALTVSAAGRPPHTVRSLG